MDYREYRAQFDTPEAFREAFRKLTKEQVRTLVRPLRAGVTVKACILSEWTGLQKESAVKES